MIRSNNLEKRLDFLAHETIGVIGCGHLGKTIASELVRRGLSCPVPYALPRQEPWIYARHN